MSGSVNKVFLVGNLGRDPEVRRLQNGEAVVSLNIATSETWRDKGSGERKDRTEWHRVVIFNENLGKVAADYLKKGSKVYLEGQLQTRKWTDKDGAEKTAVEIVLQRFRGELTLLDGRSGDSNTTERSDSASYQSSHTSPNRPLPSSGRPADRHQLAEALDDDIPF